MPELNNTSLLDKEFLDLFSRAPLTDLHKAIQDLWLSRPSYFQADQAAVCTAFARHVRTEIFMVQHDRHLFAPCTLDSMARFVHSIRTAPLDTLNEIVNKRHSELMNIDDLSIQRSLEMCLRVSFMINVNSRNMAVGGVACHERPLDWHSGESIQDLMKRAFLAKDGGYQLPRVSQIDGMLTAGYLVSNCDVEIEWTNYLTDHLRLDPNRRVLLVFRHKVFLKDRLDGAGEALMPAEVLNEALDTLNLLFPFGDLATKQLLIRHNEHDFYDLGTCGRDRVLDLSHFKYWRQELEALIDVYNSPPRTWKQLAVDRRNKLEWSAFWVTVMVAFLTLVSIPCSIIQAVYSVKSYQLALAQNNSAGRNEL